ncbi:MAG: DUF2298 domain-containing protein, partial [Anaerolineales bacterium]|nr:DUF2298 domain-containing protein [Anaerolineales bacterium]
FAQNDMGGLLLGLVIVGGLSAWSFGNRKSELVNWIGENRRLILSTELVFLVAFGAFAFFRSANPEIIGTEKPMELMFINGIMNSPDFPPRDPWLSGYSISYYYFGYVMTSMLALFTGTPATAAFNLMLSLTYGLAAVGAYGILYDMLAVGRKPNADRPSFFLPVLGPVFLLLISNVEGFLDVLHRRGFFWRFNADGSATSSFWTWLDMRELSQAPAQPLQWIPDRYLWWWRASRVVQDYDLTGNHLEAIDEFPAFSFLLGDLHPHVLAIPFVMLAVAVALNLFLGGWRGRIDLYFAQLHVNKTGFFLMAFVLGSLAFLNTWDILLGGAVIVFSYGLARVREAGWSRERTEDLVFFGIPLVGMAYVFYLPFFISFSSQASGILPSIIFPTRGVHLWVMWGTLFIPIFSYLVYLFRTKAPANWKAGFGVGLGILIVLFALMFGVALLVYMVKPEFIVPYVESQQHTIGTFLAAGMMRRLVYIGGLLTLLVLLIPAFAFLFADHRRPTANDPQQAVNGPPSVFVLLLITLGALLILGPDFVYLQDNFGYRINTIFKFYYQAWLLLSLAAAYGAAVLLKNLRGVANGIFSVFFVIVLVVGLTYPVLGALTRTNRFNPPFGFTLDDFDRLQRENPDEAAAVLWLRSAPDGNIVESTGDPYSSYGRMATYTGLPTVLGWSNHEGQWRDSSFTGLLAQRKLDVETLYATPDWQTTQFLLEQYDIRYVIVGNLERTSYRVNEEKFNNFLRPVFQQGNITIYEVP